MQDDQLAASDDVPVDFLTAERRRVAEQEQAQADAARLVRQYRAQQLAAEEVAWAVALARESVPASASGLSDSLAVATLAAAILSRRFLP